MTGNIEKIFTAQQEYKYQLRKTAAENRMAKLRQLKRNIQANEEALCLALDADLRKSVFETAVTELVFIYGELDFAIRHLKSWMKPARVGITFSTPFARNRVYYEPRGTCLIIAPWNYPFQLAMSPLISAIAAGNTAIVKPSELSAATSQIIHKIIKETFEEKEIACIEGDAETATALLSLPFDHIFFTGSTEVGKIVMAAAAKNLSSVTLELGGKSPVIVDSAANLEKAAEKIAWGKLVNAGQTCIAPDHVFIPEELKADFISYYKAAAEKMFFLNGRINPGAYARIISQKHFDRLNSLIADAQQQGATVAWNSEANEKEMEIGPVVLTNISQGSRIMQEEIFGPILPVISYKNIEEVIGRINGLSKPLALYIFSESSPAIRTILKNTSAGGTCVNDVLIHISNPKLPFGGVNGSGMGSSHGKYGFKAFSHERAVVFQSKINFTKLVYPPYENKSWVLKLLRKIM